MKNKNILIGVGLAAAAGIAYFVSKSKKQKSAFEQQITDAEIKAKQAAEKAAADLAKARAKAKVDAESIENKNSFAAKVSTIQLYLGVNADGVVGANTNKALVKKFPKYSTITTANVDSIIADIESDKKTASDLAAQKTQTSALQEKKALSAKLEDYTKSTRTGTKYYAELLKDVNAPVYAWDNLTNSYKFLGNYEKFSKGKKFYNLVDRQNGEVMSKYNDYRYAFDPKSFILKSL